MSTQTQTAGSIPKFPYSRSDWVVSEDGEIAPHLSGSTLIKVSKALRPAPAQLIKMLVELRRKQGWSRSFAAAVCGVPTSTMAKWETGKRNPSGAAAKLIFLIHSLVIERGAKIKNCYDLAVWSGDESEIEDDPELMLAGTYRFAHRLVAEKLAEEDGIHPSELPVLGKFHKESIPSSTG